MALFGYARVSTAEQSTALQTDALRKAGCERLIKELRSLHDTVADMHWQSEGLKREAVIDYGQAYLDGIGKIIP